MALLGKDLLHMHEAVEIDTTMRDDHAHGETIPEVLENRIGKGKKA